MLLAHGVGRVYESPIPVGWYLAGAAATVAVSFLLQAVSRGKPSPTQRRVGGARAAAVVRAGFRIGWLTIVLLILILGVVYAGDSGFTTVPLLFWVLFVFGTTLACSVVAGVWEEENPWAFARALYVTDTQATRGGVMPPGWLGPLLLYGLFWLELVSGAGFEPMILVLVLLGYTLYYLSFRPKFGESWQHADPLSILFGFASAVAPFEVREREITYRGFIAGLDQTRAMAPPLMGAVFVLLAATTLDNLRETVQWHAAISAVGLSQVDARVVDSIALLVLVVPFALPFFAAVAAGHRGGHSAGLFETAGRYAWTLIPIGIAYVLAHNMPLLITGLPLLVDELTDAFGFRPFRNYLPSPLLVWIVEIGLVVGGHVVAVVAAQRTAERIEGSRGAALRSHAALTAVMVAFTVATLWLLSLPIIVSGAG